MLWVSVLLRMVWVSAVLLILGGFPVLFNSTHITTNSTCQGCGIGVLLRIVWVILLFSRCVSVLFGVDSTLRGWRQQHVRLKDKRAALKLAPTSFVKAAG